MNIISKFLLGWVSYLFCFYMHSSPYLCVWRWSNDLSSGTR